MFLTFISAALLALLTAGVMATLTLALQRATNLMRTGRPLVGVGTLGAVGCANLAGVVAVPLFIVGYETLLQRQGQILGTITDTWTFFAFLGIGTMLWGIIGSLCVLQSVHRVASVTRRPTDQRL